MFLFQFFVYLLFKEYFFQGSIMPFLLELCQLYFQLPFQQFFGIFCGDSQQVFYREELRFFINDHAGVGGNTYFAIGECIQSINGDIRRNARRQLNDDLDGCGRMIGHFFDLDLSLVVGFNNAFHQLRGSNAVRNAPDHERFFIYFFNGCPHPYFASSFAFIVCAGVHGAAGLKIG